MTLMRSGVNEPFFMYSTKKYLHTFQYNFQLAPLLINFLKRKG